MGKRTTLGSHLPAAALPRRGALKWLASLAGVSVACAAQPAAGPPAQPSLARPVANTATPAPATPTAALPATSAIAPTPSAPPAAPATATHTPPAPTRPPLPATLVITQPAQANSAAFVRYAAQMRQLAIDAGDQAYGAIIVKGDRVVGLGPSRVVVNADATAHAEMEAIRDASRRLGSGDLSGCVLYSTSPPCAMCESAAYWARVARLVHGPNAVDAGAPRYGACG
jgi:tRNA(Arg) A34 adenosine deaminase TadA